MTEYELNKICARGACDCNCMRCKSFAQSMREELGLDEDYDDEGHDDEGYEEQPYEYGYDFNSDIF